MTQATLARPAMWEPLAARARELADQGPPWLRRLRREGLARFEELGWPTPRLEAWKATNLAPVAELPFRPAVAAPATGALPALPALARPALDGPRLVLLDGRPLADRSDLDRLPRGVWFGSLGRALAEIPERVEAWLVRRPVEHARVFRALATALVEDGAVLLIDEATAVDRPLQIVHVSSGSAEPTASFPRTLIVAGRSSRATVVETFVGLGDGAYFCCAATDAFVGDGAALEHYRLQLEGRAGFHVSDWISHQTRDSRYVSHNVNLGGRLARHDVEAVLDGEGADCRLWGLYLTRGEQHVDNHTLLDHAQPHGASREVYKGILDDRSRAVFNGRIIVRPGAQKTDAKQSNPNLVLSAGALAHTRPQLEIYADDVRCTHGATVGRLDEEAIFYLRSRGVGRDDARRMLIEAFAGEVLEAMTLDALREPLRQAILRRLVAEG